MKKFSKPICLLFAIAIIFGCGKMSNMHIAKGKFICKDNGGMYEFYPFPATANMKSTKHIRVLCMDGTTYTSLEINDIIITDSDFYPDRMRKHEL